MSAPFSWRGHTTKFVALVMLNHTTPIATYRTAAALPAAGVMPSAAGHTGLSDAVTVGDALNRTDGDAVSVDEAVPVTLVVTLVVAVNVSVAAIDIVVDDVSAALSDSLSEGDAEDCGVCEVDGDGLDVDEALVLGSEVVVSLGVVERLPEGVWQAVGVVLADVLALAVLVGVGVAECVLVAVEVMDGLSERDNDDVAVLVPDRVAEWVDVGDRDVVTYAVLEPVGVLVREAVIGSDAVLEVVWVTVGEWLADCVGVALPEGVDVVVSELEAVLLLVAVTVGEGSRVAEQRVGA